MDPARLERLLAATLPQPSAAAPSMESIAWPSFWARFEVYAPWHLRAGLRAADLLIGVVYASLRGARMLRLDAAGCERLVEDASKHALLGPLVDILKLVACLAYFDDARAQSVFRGAPA